jgi:hypothetical protein
MSDLKMLVADELVRLLYSGFDMESLRAMVGIGKTYEAEAESPEALLNVTNLNSALEREIARRKSEAVL